MIIHTNTHEFLIASHIFYPTQTAWPSSSLSPADPSPCLACTATRTMGRSPSCPYSGGGPRGEGCCVITSSTRPSRTAPGGTASPTARAASCSPSSRSEHRTTAHTCARSASATTCRITASTWPWGRVRGKHPSPHPPSSLSFVRMGLFEQNTIPICCCCRWLCIG